MTPWVLSFQFFHSHPGADHCCNSVHPTWTQSPPKEGEGLPVVSCSISALSRPLDTCNLSVFGCMPITKPVSGERCMIIKVNLESLGTDFFATFSWLCSRKAVPEQPASFKKERIIWVEWSVMR